MKKTTSLLLCTLLLAVAVAQAQSNKPQSTGEAGARIHIRSGEGSNPAIKDGKPVSMWIQLEYHFNLDND